MNPDKRSAAGDTSKRRSRRADIEIYHPGALRQQKTKPALNQQQEDAKHESSVGNKKHGCSEANTSDRKSRVTRTSFNSSVDESLYENTGNNGSMQKNTTTKHLQEKKVNPVETCDLHENAGLTQLAIETEDKVSNSYNGKGSCGKYNKKSTENNSSGSRLTFSNSNFKKKGNFDAKRIECVKTANRNNLNKSIEDNSKHVDGNTKQAKSTKPSEEHERETISNKNNSWDNKKKSTRSEKEYHNKYSNLTSVSCTNNDSYSKSITNVTDNCPIKSDAMSKKLPVNNNLSSHKEAITDVNTKNTSELCTENSKQQSIYNKGNVSTDSMRKDPCLSSEGKSLVRGRGRGRKSRNEDNIVHAVEQMTIGRLNKNAGDNSLQSKLYKETDHRYDEFDVDKRLYNPNKDDRSKISHTQNKIQNFTTSQSNKIYHVEALEVDAISIALLAQHKQELLQQQLGEVIKPMVFINQSDDEEDHHIATTIDWAEESYREIQKDKQIVTQSEHKSHKPSESQQQTYATQYEQNLKQYLNRKQLQSDASSLRHHQQYTDNPYNLNTGSIVDDRRRTPVNKHSYANSTAESLCGGTGGSMGGTKQLFNPDDPSKPLLVPAKSRDAVQSSVLQAPAAYDDFTTAAEQLSVTGASAAGGYDELLHSIEKGERDILYYVNSNQIPLEFPRIMDIRSYLRNCYMRLFNNNILLCHQKNIEAQMWKTLYYNIIEKLREYIMRSPELRDRSVSTLLMLVKEGHEYLQNVISGIEVGYGVQVRVVVCSLSGDGEEYRGRRKLALGVVQRLLLDLGDLARYRQQCVTVPAAHHTLPHRWYQLASRLYPRNGRPFHQLAILSVTQKRPLDVFYYYVRSLMAANSFVSAKDSLTSFFDGIRKKFESQLEELGCNDSPAAAGGGLGEHAMERQGGGGHAMERQGGVVGGGTGLHREVWVRPDSGATKRTTTRSHAAPLDQQQLEDDPVHKLVLTLAPDQLMKQFLTCYLHCHGLLFSRVSLEVFGCCCHRMLLLFSALLQTSPPRLSATHLLQIHALNMFAVRNTHPVHDASQGVGYRSAAQELALVLAQEMFARLAQHVAKILPHNINTNLNSTTKPPSSASPDNLLQQNSDASYKSKPSSNNLNPDVSSSVYNAESNSKVNSLTSAASLNHPDVASMGASLVVQHSRRNSYRNNSISSDNGGGSEDGATNCTINTSDNSLDATGSKLGKLTSGVNAINTTNASAGGAGVTDATANASGGSANVTGGVPPAASIDPCDVPGMTLLLDQVEQDHSSTVVQLPRLLMPLAAHFVPALKVWCDWLMHNSSTWHPPSLNSEYCTPGYECWSSVAEMATLLHGLGAPDVSVVAAGGADAVTPLVLDEDKFLKGFEPLLSSHQIPPMFTTDTAQVSRGCDWVRVQLLQTVLCRFLCGLEPPVLRMQKTPDGDVLTSALATPNTSPSPPATPPQLRRKNGGDSAAEDETIEETSSSDDDGEDLDDSSSAAAAGGEGAGVGGDMQAAIRTLLRRKHFLDKQKRRIQRQKRRSECEVTVELEVHPKYLVPDTNCFITHLPYLSRIVTPSSPYTLLVPLVVVGELEGLSREDEGGNGSGSNDDAEVVHGASRAECARQARQFVRSRDHNIKIITTQGSIVPSSDYHEAATDAELTNDDRILLSCQHFCRSDGSASAAAKGGVERVLCDAVLLTADRNLAIKAYAANVPVRSVPQFRRWASDGHDAEAGVNDARTAAGSGSQSTFSSNIIGDGRDDGDRLHARRDHHRRGTTTGSLNNSTQLRNSSSRSSKNRREMENEQQQRTRKRGGYSRSNSRTRTGAGGGHYHDVDHQGTIEDTTTTKQLNHRKHVDHATNTNSATSAASKTSYNTSDNNNLLFHRGDVTYSGTSDSVANNKSPKQNRNGSASSASTSSAYASSYNTSCESEYRSHNPSSRYSNNNLSDRSENSVSSQRGQARSLQRGRARGRGRSVPHNR